jgi:ATP-binding cassette, subfamily C (CFTR/MRP), member 2
MTAHQLSSEEKADWYNTIIFGWLNPTIQRGYESRLEPGDALILPELFDHRVCFAAFKRVWAIHEHNAWRMHKAIYAVCGDLFVKSMVFIILSLSQELGAIFFVNKLITYLDSPGAPLSDGVLWAGMLGGSMMLNAVIRAHAMYWCKLCGISMRSVILAAIFDKILKLGPKSHQETSGGKVVNQMAAGVF